MVSLKAVSWDHHYLSYNYMTVLQQVCRKSHYLLYADDTVIFGTNEIDLATHEIQYDLNIFKMWCDHNQLLIRN